MHNTIDLIGYFGAICLSVLTIPQVIQSWKRRSVDGVSKWFMFIQWITCITFVLYGSLIVDYPIIIANSIALLGSSMLIYMRWYFHWYHIVPTTNVAHV